MFNNAEPRYLLRYPFVLRVGTSNALGSFRIFKEALPVIGDPAGVQLVIEDPIPSATVAVDRRRIPLASARARNGFMIEARGDLPGSYSTGIFHKDAADDCSLCGIDLSFACRDRSIREQSASDAVSVAFSAGDLTCFDSATLTTADLLGEVF